ncbi:hypothetical protein QR680_019202 [Steinernema hermaphroditum]|uniref:Transmembrane protein n=1 Tax=Steinernema hermaphroditum TaxID=289476 RepID=A0AA39HKB0_9BILA|nr:hypothetical protein QR680_019202 [Steinernema hermaphroditum]
MRDVSKVLPLILSIVTSVLFTTATESVSVPENGRLRDHSRLPSACVQKLERQPGSKFHFICASKEVILWFPQEFKADSFRSSSTPDACRTCRHRCLTAKEYALLELNLEELLGDEREANVSLIGRMYESTTKVIDTHDPVSSCTFADVKLFCFWIDDDRKRVFQQKFELGKKDLRYSSKEKAVLFDKAGIRQLSQKVITSVWDYEQEESASVFLYDPTTKGWLYRVSNASFLAGCQKRKNMHRIHVTQGKLVSLASMDKSVLMATECDPGGCRYTANFLQITAFSPHACAFMSKKPMAVGFIMDVRGGEDELEPEPSNHVIQQFVQNNPVRQGYEPIISLATVTLASTVIYFIAAFTRESVTGEGNKRCEEKLDSLWVRYVDWLISKSSSPDRHVSCV